MHALFVFVFGLYGKMYHVPFLCQYFFVLTLFMGIHGKKPITETLGKKNKIFYFMQHLKVIKMIPFETTLSS